MRLTDPPPAKERLLFYRSASPQRETLRESKRQDGERAEETFKVSCVLVKDYYYGSRTFSEERTWG